MNLEITSCHDEINNCLEDCFMTLARWLNRNYIYMYAEAWDFKFDEFNVYEYLGQRMNVRSNNFIDLLDKYHGIKSNPTYEFSSKKIIKIFKNEFKKRFPVLVSFDPFYLPWDDSFNIFHTKHSFLLSGYNSKNSSFYCVDPYFEIEQELSYKNLINGLNFFVTFEVRDVQYPIDWKYIIKNAIKNFNQNNSVKNIKIFADCLCKYQKFSEEINNFKIEMFNDAYGASIIGNLNILVKKRKQFSRVLEYIGKTKNIDSIVVLSNRFEEVSKLWKKTNDLLIKAYYKDSPLFLLERASNYLKEVAGIESFLVNELEKCINTTSSTSVSKK